MKPIIETLKIDCDREFKRIEELYHDGFTPWYPKLPNRKMVNTLAQTLPEFFLQVRTDNVLPDGYIFTLPIYWNQDPQSLQSFDYYTVDRFRGNWYSNCILGAHTLTASYLPLTNWVKPWCLDQIRDLFLKDANTLMILAMILKPEARGKGLSRAFFEHFKHHLCQQTGFQSVVGPFRPSGFGKFKSENDLSLSQENFYNYCHTKRDGLPIDPWLRSATRNGVKFLECEPRSIRVTKSILAFEELKRDFKPKAWRQVVQDVWECGEVPTWYVDRNTKQAFSLEPNIWGTIKVDRGTHHAST